MNMGEPIMTRETREAIATILSVSAELCSGAEFNREDCQNMASNIETAIHEVVASIYEKAAEREIDALFRDAYD